jgi:hypothetical protein
MKKNNSATAVMQKPIFLVIYVASFITLYFNPSLQDPFNAPKQWILLISSAWLIGYLIVDRKSWGKNREISGIKKLLFMFILCLLISAVLTDVKYVAFIGETQRKLGFLTYFCLAIYMFVAVVYTRINILHRLYMANFVTGLLLGTYALMQNYGKDFVQWNNPYNKILGTLGNPNFASASMAIIACLCFASLFVKEFNFLFRLANSLLFTLLMFAVISSDSRQGLVAFSVGAGALIVVQLKNKSNSLGWIGLLLFIFAGILSILGMLQIGPLTDLLYKGSVTVRGYYWRAGFEMFQNNPLSGIGVDRYGAYFKEYRDTNYALTYGFDITSSNAHNTFIQLFATSGLFVGLLYVLINIYVLVCGIKTILKIRSDLRAIFTGIFSAWLVYLAQTFISIDNIGVTIWGWLLGGIIIAISINAPTNFESQKNSLLTDVNNKNLNSKSVSLQPIFSGIFTLIAIVFVSFLYRGEVIPMQTIGFYNSTSPTNSSPKHFEMSQKIFNMTLIDPNYKFSVAKQVAMTGKKNEALSELKLLNKYDSRSLDYLLALAALSENIEDYRYSILKRNEIAKLDPWNAKNYLELGRDYKLIGEFTEMERCKKIILEFAANTPEASIALTELVS